MTPLVSILIPCHNAAPWVAEAIASAQAQTWANTEIIVVDDGSTDTSLSVAQSFSSPTVRVIHQPNRGASAARNRALQEAQGDFIQYLDADDLLSPEKIERQLQVLMEVDPAQRGTHLAICGTMHFFEGTLPAQGIYEDGLPFATDSDRPEDWLVRLWGGDGAAGMVHPAAWLVPRAVAIAAGSWNEALSLDDDGEYFARVVLASSGIRRVDGVMSFYRKYRNGRSLSAGRTEAHFRSALHALDLKAHHLLSRTQTPQAKQALASRYQELAVAAYPQRWAIAQRALHCRDELGGCPIRPKLGGRRIEWIQRLLGWKVARCISVGVHAGRKIWEF